MRLFVAIDPPSFVKGGVENVVDALRPRVAGARWNRPEGRHFTLRFLGETPDPDVAIFALRDVRAASFEMTLDAVGAFASWRRARVLWIGATGEFAPLAEAVNASLAPAFGPAEKPFRPHLTLARFPEPVRLDDPGVEVPACTWEVTEFVLFRSRLHPKGARYEALQRFPLERR